MPSTFIFSSRGSIVVCFDVIFVSDVIFKLDKFMHFSWILKKNVNFQTENDWLLGICISWCSFLLCIPWFIFKGSFIIALLIFIWVERRTIPIYDLSLSLSPSLPPSSSSLSLSLSVARRVWQCVCVKCMATGQNSLYLWILWMADWILSRKNFLVKQHFLNVLLSE